jgi:FkbH-like protein
MTNTDKEFSDNYNITNINFAKNFINIFINNYVNKFRNFNNDILQISISGINNFIKKENNILEYLIDKLNENNIRIEFIGDYKRINNLNIICNNITSDLTFNFNYQIQNLPAIIDISAKTEIPATCVIIMKIIAQIISKFKILYKVIVLDLDDTLWNGTISEIGIEKLRDNLYSEDGNQFIRFMKFISTLGSELGLFIAICSRNDLTLVESTLDKLEENIFPIKNRIDIIIANYNDKSENIKIIAEQLNVLTSSIIFIDDNQIIRDEVKQNLPDVFVPEWKKHCELTTLLITTCAFERFELSLNSQNRKKQYKIIQKERKQNFLPTLLIKVINDENNIESNILYSKSNQFKFSSKDDSFEKEAKSLYFEILRECGENLGICSAFTYTLTNDTLLIHNWAISCRYFEIGLEEFILSYIYKLSNGKKVLIYYLQSDYNQKIIDLIHNYSESFKIGEKSDNIEIIFTKQVVENFNNKTNLRLI